MGKKNKYNGQLWEEQNGLAPPFVEGMLAIDRPSIRTGRNIPEKMLLGIEESGLYMGLEQEYGKGYYVGKRTEDDGNVLVVGINGSGKSFFLA